jgi:peptidyl-dipeptidase A
MQKDLVRVMANSRDFEELLYTWRSWRDNIGHEIRPKYIKYMELVNEAAISIGIVIFLFIKNNKE